MFTKFITDISYADIDQLKQESIEESDILDYKEDFPISDDTLIKHVCAFANTRGGYLIFGVKESGDGGHPTEIKGIDSDKINKERIENIILAHITPRLVVGIKAIEIPNSTKSILVIHIPDSYLRPHYSKDNKFYKRFNFKSEAMTEQEIADLYKRRFSNREQVNRYVKKILVGLRIGLIIGNIVILPSNIDHRLIDTFDSRKFQWIEDIRLKTQNNEFGKSIVPCLPTPFSYGLTHAKPLHDNNARLSIHRNGCIHYVQNFRFDSTAPKHSIRDKELAVRIVETLEFAHIIMLHYNYFGEMKIIVTLNGPRGTEISELAGTKPPKDLLCVKIRRECPLEYLGENYEKVAASIMHEVVNYYGMPRCPHFDENDKLCI